MVQNFRKNVWSHIYHVKSTSRVQRPYSIYINCQEQKPLVVVGSINTDIVLKIERLPKAGETIGASSLEYFPGGKGANQAAAAALLGQETKMIGQIGTDENADFMINALSSRGVDLSLVRRVEGSTGAAVILLQPSGENSIVIVGGANTADWAITDDGQATLQSAGCVLLQREIPEKVNMAVATIARNAGTDVIMDAGGVDELLPDKLLDCLSMVSPNETELARLTGLPTNSLHQVEEAAKKLLQMGVKSVLVKLGAEGAFYVDQEKKVYQKAFKVDKVVDTTGAGDCFTAAYAVGRLQGKDVQQAMKFAAAAGAVCVQRMGAMTSLPAKAETLEFMAQFQ
eukprot:TRINITY_DN103659_c0_g1_i1.p1 TRINITY_DN103659_c0_g1~~TRINITY_DN103659_c0_g1_i1.p1  ORF type:complete len:373 (-),score=39.88 TRINITY_DN103659_c0_g1_i1:166-1188(-)